MLYIEIVEGQISISGDNTTHGSYQKGYINYIPLNSKIVFYRNGDERYGSIAEAEYGDIDVNGTIVTNDNYKEVLKDLFFLGSGGSDTDAYTKDETNSLLSEKANNSEVEALQHANLSNIGLPAFNPDTYTITFTANDGSTQVVDLPLESLANNLSYDPDTKSLIITKQDGSTISVPVSDLIKEYAGSNGDQIQIVIGTGNVIQAILKDGSITYDKLSTSLINTINASIDNAVANAKPPVMFRSFSTEKTITGTETAMNEFETVITDASDYVIKVDATFVADSITVLLGASISDIQCGLTVRIKRNGTEIAKYQDAILRSGRNVTRNFESKKLSLSVNDVITVTAQASLPTGASLKIPAGTDTTLKIEKVKSV